MNSELQNVQEDMVADEAFSIYNKVLTQLMDKHHPTIKKMIKSKNIKQTPCIDLELRTLRGEEGEQQNEHSVNLKKNVKNPTPSSYDASLLPLSLQKYVLTTKAHSEHLQVTPRCSTRTNCWVMSHKMCLAMKT